MCVRVRPSVGVFLFAVGPMTAIEISDLIRFEEKRGEERGRVEHTMQRHSSSVATSFGQDSAREQNKE